MRPKGPAGHGSQFDCWSDPGGRWLIRMVSPAVAVPCHGRHLTAAEHVAVQLVGVQMPGGVVDGDGPERGDRRQPVGGEGDRVVVRARRRVRPFSSARYPTPRNSSAEFPRMPRYAPAARVRWSPAKNARLPNSSADDRTAAQRAMHVRHPLGEPLARPRLRRAGPDPLLRAFSISSIGQLLALSPVLRQRGHELQHPVQRAQEAEVERPPDVDGAARVPASAADRRAR